LSAAVVSAAWAGEAATRAKTIVATAISFLADARCVCVVCNL